MKKINHYQAADGRELGAEAGSTMDDILRKDHDFTLVETTEIEPVKTQHAAAKARDHKLPESQKPHKSREHGKE